MEVHTAIRSAAGDATTLEMRIATILGQLEPLQGLDSSSLVAGIKAGIAEAKDRAEEGFGPLTETVNGLENPHLALAALDAKFLQGSLSPNTSISPQEKQVGQQCHRIERNMETIEGLLHSLIEIAAAVQTQIKYFAKDMGGKVELADNIVEQIQIYQEETGLI